MSLALPSLKLNAIIIGSDFIHVATTSVLKIWIWIHTLQEPLLIIFATEVGERNAKQKLVLFSQ